MFAHRIMDFTGPDDVQWVEVPESAENLGDGGVVIDVVAAGVSFADLLQTRGAYQMRVALPYTPGMDAAGVVRSAAPGLGLRAGQRVAVLLSYGCWQEVVSAPAERILPLPDGMSFEAGAAAPLNYLTSLFALVRRARAQAGETLLVHGAAGGVGTAAVQLGRALGLRTVAVAGDEAKKEFALRCGADHAVVTDGWLAAVRDLVGERAVDIVVDPVGNDRMTDSLRSLAPEGRLLVLGFAGGEIPVVKANRLLLGNTGVLGVASREFFEQRPAIVAELWTQLMDLRRTGALADPPVEAYPFAGARGALRAIADRKARGKIVLSRRVDAAPPLDQSALAGEVALPRRPAVPMPRRVPRAASFARVPPFPRVYSLFCSLVACAVRIRAVCARCTHGTVVQREITAARLRTGGSAGPSWDEHAGLDLGGAAARTVSSGSGSGSSPYFVSTAGSFRDGVSSVATVGERASRRLQSKSRRL
jgi:NADPH:quinone reductase